MSTIRRKDATLPCVNASCALVLLIAVLVVYFGTRRLVAALALKRQLESTLGELKILVDVAHETQCRSRAAELACCHSDSRRRSGRAEDSDGTGRESEAGQEGTAEGCQRRRQSG